MEALKAYKEALVFAPDCVRARLNSALTLQRLGRHKEAHEAATLALMLEPENVKAYYTRHKAKVALGDYRVSVLCCRKFRTEHPCLSSFTIH